MAERRPLRALLGWVGVAAVGIVAVLIVPGQSAAQQSEADEAVLARGGELYAQYCQACHGSDGAGMPGTGVMAGPPLTESTAAYNDLLLRSGRMPIIEERAGIIWEPDLSGDAREALVAWMVNAFDLVDDIPQVAQGDPANGHVLYATYCAACHGSTGAGGVASDGTYVRAVRGLDAVAIVESIRVGPFQMPRFDEDIIDDGEADDIAAFVVDYINGGPATPLALVEINRVAMTALAGVLVLVVAGVVFVISRTAPTEAVQEHGSRGGR